MELEESVRYRNNILPQVRYRHLQHSRGDRRIQIHTDNAGGHKEKSSILATNTTLVYEPKCGGGGGGCSVSVKEYSFVQNWDQINFRDLTLYLTYEIMDPDEGGPKSNRNTYQYPNLNHKYHKYLQFLFLPFFRRASSNPEIFGWWREQTVRFWDSPLADWFLWRSFSLR